jgi:hypothetical protein
MKSPENGGSLSCTFCYATATSTLLAVLTGYRLKVQRAASHQYCGRLFVHGCTILRSRFWEKVEKQVFSPVRNLRFPHVNTRWSPILSLCAAREIAYL